ncbi:MAG: monovalent cation/H(+) antiporter subunit G, partial [Acidilobaceae archaeon]
MFTEVAITIGSVIVLISSFLQLLSAVGIIRFPDFYVRLHAATVSAIGGSLLAIALGSPLVILGSSGLTQESLINVARCLLTAL